MAIQAFVESQRDGATRHMDTGHGLRCRLCRYVTRRYAAEIPMANSTHTVVTTVSSFTSVQLTFSNQLLTVLGTALGFVISFRTSTAYERCVAQLAVLSPSALTYGQQVG